MRSTIIFSYAALLLNVAAHFTPRAPNDPAHDPNFVHFDCGNNQSHASDHLLETVKALHVNAYTGPPSAKLRARALEARQAAASGSIVIPTVFHIVTTTGKKDSIGPDTPSLQIAAMNKAYAPVGFSFNLINTTNTVNDAWAVGSGDDINAMKKALRQGTYSTLNIYFQSDLSGGVLGICSMPSQVGNSNSTQLVDPKTYFDDGCSVNAGTMPNGTVFGYSQGMTAIHETGHWLGLFHVFEGYSCSGDGDLIADTPPQSESTDGCPTSPPKDSCPGDKWPDGTPMVDAIHNIMDYSTDACYQGFTQLQIQRMKQLWGMYRQGM